MAIELIEQKEVPELQTTMLWEMDADERERRIEELRKQLTDQEGQEWQQNGWTPTT